MGPISKTSQDGNSFSFTGTVSLSPLLRHSMRTVSLVPHFSALGGLYFALTLLCSTFVSAWVKADYLRNVVGALFMVKRYGKGEGKDRGIGDKGKGVTFTQLVM